MAETLSKTEKSDKTPDYRWMEEPFQAMIQALCLDAANISFCEGGKKILHSSCIFEDCKLNKALGQTQSGGKAESSTLISLSRPERFKAEAHIRAGFVPYREKAQADT